MNNEIQRKITSLTLMTIMLAGGMVVAIPGMEPAHAATVSDGYLTVSSSTFGGPMVIMITVDDPSLDETNEVKGQPNVTIDGKDLVMAQGDDGTWYAFIAEKGIAYDANDAGSEIINFGSTCEDTDLETAITGASFDDSTLVYTFTPCDSTQVTHPNYYVVDNPRNLNGNLDANPITVGTEANSGQIGVVDQYLVWPFIQTFDFTDGSDIDVIYDGSTDQEVTIKYDEEMDSFAKYSTDRTTYPHGADVHLTIEDMQLNIDPTSFDVWTFDVENGESYWNYGSDVLESGYQNLLDYGDNGFINIIDNDVLTIVDNADTPEKYGSNANSYPYEYFTVIETSSNSGIFENTDNGNNANLKTTDDVSIRGDSGIIEYNNEASSILVGFFNGNIDMDKSSIDNEWNSGESLTVNITDEDQNTNTLLSNDFDITEDVTIPTIQIGSPVTLASTIGVTVEGTADLSDLNAQKDAVTIQRNDAISWVTGNQTQVNLIDMGDLVTDVAGNQTAFDDAEFAVTRAYGDPTTPDTVLESLIDALALAESKLAVANDLLSEKLASLDVAQRNYFTDLATSKQLVEQYSETLTLLAIAINTADGNIPVPYTIGPFSKTLLLDFSDIAVKDLNPTITITTNIDSSLLNDLNKAGVHRLINWNFESLEIQKITLTGDTGEFEVTGSQSDLLSASTLLDDGDDPFVGDLTIVVESTLGSDEFVKYKNIVFDIFTIGQDADGNRYNDSIYRLEAAETTDDSGIYSGTVEYTMLSQYNIFEDSLFTGIDTISDTLEIIVHEDMTDEDSVEIIYNDQSKQGNIRQVSAQTDAPTQSAKVSFDNTNYKVADTVTITLEDSDLNADSGLVDIYTVVRDTDIVSHPDQPDRSKILNVEFNGVLWADICSDATGLYDAMSSLVETEADSGIFTASFQIPSVYCIDENTSESVTGLDIKVNYVDFRDASGEEIEVGDSAGVGASTGSISLDRTVYPVPFGTPEDGESYFAVHETAIDVSEDADEIGDLNTYISNGDLIIHLRIDDSDFDISANGEDKLAVDAAHGPVKIIVSRGSESLLIGTAGADTKSSGSITIGDDVVVGVTQEFGPIEEIAPDAGIFELDVTISFTDGPASSSCPTVLSTSDAYDHIDRDSDDDKHCILQGDILTVTYNDPTDASGDQNSVTDSATFDLRNGVLQTDKSVYLIGSDMILTLIDPDFDLDNDQAETISLDLIEWDSDAATVTMGILGDRDDAFDPQPSNFRETGDSTGIFQTVVEIPSELRGDNLERGEGIELEYVDWGPSGADFVGDDSEDITTDLYTSNFGATVELDQKVYTWTDKIYVTVVAPDHNFDPDLVDEIGNTEDDPVKVSTRTDKLDGYKLVETGTDTGIFTGEIILTGFTHDADGDTTTGVDGNDVVSEEAHGSGPTSGFLPAGDDDGLTVSFEFSDKEIATGSALIRWNIGETQWLEASYPASGTGVLRVIDPDMNLKPEAVDNFSVDVWSDSDAGGIDLTVTETNEATGIFEGTVFFTTTDESSGHRLRVAEGDTVTAEYEDNTLPDPYTTADELDITATTLIGTVVPPLERAPAANLRAVDAFGNSLDAVSVDQQVQITADLANGQDREQKFAYLVQIQNKNGVTVSLSWITGELTPAQRLAPAVSWIPEDLGEYTATVFVWESVDNPTALSPPVSTTISVS